MDRDTQEIIHILKRFVAAMLVLFGIVALSAACYLLVSTLKLLTG